MSQDRIPICQTHQCHPLQHLLPLQDRMGFVLGFMLLHPLNFPEESLQGGLNSSRTPQNQQKESAAKELMQFWGVHAFELLRFAITCCGAFLLLHSLNPKQTRNEWASLECNCNYP